MLTVEEAGLDVAIGSLEHAPANGRRRAALAQLIKTLLDQLEARQAWDEVGATLQRFRRAPGFDESAALRVRYAEAVAAAAEHWTGDLVPLRGHVLGLPHLAAFAASKPLQEAFYTAAQRLLAQPDNDPSQEALHLHAVLVSAPNGNFTGLLTRLLCDAVRLCRKKRQLLRLQSFVTDARPVPAAILHYMVIMRLVQLSKEKSVPVEVLVEAVRRLPDPTSMLSHAAAQLGWQRVVELAPDHSEAQEALVRLRERQFAHPD